MSKMNVSTLIGLLQLLTFLPVQTSVDLLKASTTDLTGWGINWNFVCHLHSYRFLCQSHPPAECKQDHHSGLPVGQKKTKHKVTNESSYFQQYLKSSNADSVPGLLCFGNTAADWEDPSLSRNYRSVPNWISLFLFSNSYLHVTLLSDLWRHNWPNSPFLLTSLKTYKCQAQIHPAKIER